jgi:hypothetical protein
LLLAVVIFVVLNIYESNNRVKLQIRGEKWSLT